MITEKMQITNNHKLPLPLLYFIVFVAIVVILGGLWSLILSVGTSINTTRTEGKIVGGFLCNPLDLIPGKYGNSKTGLCRVIGFQTIDGKTKKFIGAEDSSPQNGVVVPIKYNSHSAFFAVEDDFWYQWFSPLIRIILGGIPLLVLYNLRKQRSS